MHFTSRRIVVLFLMALIGMGVPLSAQSRKMVWRGSGDGNRNAPGAPLAMMGEILLSEDFESGELPSDPWEIVITNSNEPWFAGLDTENLMNGTYIAWVNYDTDNPSDEWIITPDIDLTGVENPNLYFSRYYGIPDPWSEYATLYVRISTDGGTTFPDTIYSITPDSPAKYLEVNIPLDGYQDMEISIGFQYAGQDGDSVGLDDIYVVDGELEGVQIMSWGRLKHAFTR
jgi:hypothetical protein